MSLSYTPNSHCVYLIKDHQGFYKIGRTRDLHERLDALNLAHAIDLVVADALWVQSYEIATALETFLHRTLLKYHVAREWFRFTSMKPWNDAVEQSLAYSNNPAALRNAVKNISSRPHLSSPRRSIQRCSKTNIPIPLADYVSFETLKQMYKQPPLAVIPHPRIQKLNRAQNVLNK